MSERVTIETLKLEISELKTLLAVERSRCKIFKDLVTSNTNIKFKDFSVRRAPIPDSDMVVEPEPEPEPEPLLEPKPLPGEQDINSDINEMFERVRTTKTFSKTISDIQKKRVLLMSIMSISKFKETCELHISTLNEIFISKGFSDKKIESQITKALSSIEMRLLKHPGYFNSHLDVDDKQNIVKVLGIQQETTQGGSFQPSDIARSLMNYGSVIINMKTNLTRIIGSHKNIIYVDKPSSNKTDPFSFYTLSSSDDKKMNWVMDCRLEELTTSIRDDILPFLISTFKELYFDVFGDNVYRKDYKERCPLTECDCQQLLTNIYTMSSNNTLNTMLKNIVRESSTHVPIKGVDKFNISSDDQMQKQRWKTFCDESTECARLLFDEISNEDAIEFEKTFSTKY